MWSDDDGPFHGKHYQLAETLNSPQPLQQPHPPIMIGGGGEKKTLRLVAKYADACNIFAGDRPAEVAHKLDVLRDCATGGPAYDEIRRTVLYTVRWGRILLAPPPSSRRCAPSPVSASTRCT